MFFQREPPFLIDSMLPAGENKYVMSMLGGMENGTVVLFQRRASGLIPMRGMVDGGWRRISLGVVRGEKQSD